MNTDRQSQVGALIVAAGSSERMMGIDKIRVALGGSPLISRTIDAFEKCDAVDATVLVVAQESWEWMTDLVASFHWSKVIRVVVGGKRRQDSVRLGLKVLNDCEWIIVHDGARPLVSTKLIEYGLTVAKRTGAAVPGVPPVDTIKEVNAQGFVLETLDRRTLAAIQTPQVFRKELLDQAHAQDGADATDDASLLESCGVPVEMFKGEPTNIKVTIPADLIVAEALWRFREVNP